MNKFLKLMATSALAAGLFVSGNAFAFQAKDASKSSSKAASSTAPSDKDISDAKSKGQVWVNTSTKVYHKDGEFYGKTKQGKFMSEDDAKKAGYRAAKTSPIGKKKTDSTKK